MIKRFHVFLMAEVPYNCYVSAQLITILITNRVITYCKYEGTQITAKVDNR